MGYLPMINMIYEDNHILVVEKPVNVPVQADQSNDKDLLNILKSYIKEKYHKPGNVYLGLVHRLDRPVGGIMVFAKTSKAASRLSEQIRKHLFQKEYYAIVIGSVKSHEVLKDKLYKDPKTNTTIVSRMGKEAELEYVRIKQNNNLSLVKINLKTGRSHQIRVQFSSRSHPLYGDQKYNKNAKPQEQVALFASKISFEHPTTKQYMEFSLPLPTRNPWNQFN